MVDKHVINFLGSSMKLQVLLCSSMHRTHYLLVIVFTSPKVSLL